MGNTEVFDNRVSDHLAPCIAQFAVAAGDETYWKNNEPSNLSQNKTFFTSGYTAWRYLPSLSIFYTDFETFF